MEDTNIQNNYIEKIILNDVRDKQVAEISVSYPEEEDEKGHITVICGKNHSGKSYILKKISEALKERRKYTKGILECDEDKKLQVKFSEPDAVLPKPQQILSIGDPTSTKRIYEEINSITFKKLSYLKIFISILYFNDKKNDIFREIHQAIFPNEKIRFRRLYLRRLYLSRLYGELDKKRSEEYLKKHSRKYLEEYFQKDCQKYFHKYFQEDFQEDLKEYLEEYFQACQVYLQEDFQKYFQKYFQEDCQKYFQEDFQENYQVYLQEDFQKHFQTYFQEDFQTYFQKYFQEILKEDFQTYFQKYSQEYFQEFNCKIFSNFFNSALKEEHHEFQIKIKNFNRIINNDSENFDVFDKIYLCKQSNPLVKTFQKAVEGYLYFGAARNTGMIPTFVIRSFDGERILKYTDWSDGEKAIFTFLLEIYYVKPEILLIDEIETHFHPDYISELLFFIKRTAKQSIIVTHHPHVIFSRFIDKVIYISPIENSDKQHPAKNIEIINEETFKKYKARRKIQELNTYQKKIESTYSLFDQKDHQVLQLYSLFAGEDWNESIANESQTPREKLFDKIRCCVGIDEHLFLIFTELMTSLSHIKYEKNYISPALVLIQDDSNSSSNSEIQNFEDPIIKNQQQVNNSKNEGTLEKCIKDITESALKVKEKNRTFVVRKIGIQYFLEKFTLPSKQKENLHDNNDNLLFYDRHPVQNLIQEKKWNACAWVLPGDSSIQLYTKEEVLANYRDGKWKPRNFKDYISNIEKLTHNFADPTHLDKKVLFQAFRICILASKNKVGIVLAIELEGRAIRDLCDFNTLLNDQNRNNEIENIKEKNIRELNNEDELQLYLDSIAGDGAAILDSCGQTLAVNAIFQPKPNTKLENLIGKGTRHINSQKITKETKEAIIFVVSTDGPITVFYDGKAVFRIL